MLPTDLARRALRSLFFAQILTTDPRVRAHLADAVRSVLAAIDVARAPP